ncbi:YcfL family protein [Shewanella sp. Isolate11]|uniref:YcfL family protein n=1 Tax=Shewanella sp. Isolate11 TaxID=2908530 RepID=UPI001EFE5D6D|nr:YcfL family protein [Shewanella sp. Isolate11]MCG9696437.1 YcfL family protein [Shewanella sp. Isolate11]
MKMKYLVILLLLGLSACAHNTAGIMASSTGEQRIDNSSFASDVIVERVFIRSNADRLTAAGIIRSQVSTDTHLQYKFTWYDVNGLTIEDEGMSWKALKLHGMQQMQVNSVSPTSQAVRCELYVRKVFSN